MRPSAQAAFPGWLRPFEGDYRKPYLDVARLPTVGLAFLCPLSTALTLAWTLPSGELATPADIHDAYETLFGYPGGKGGSWYQDRTRITLSPHSFDALYASKLREFEADLRSARHVGPAWDALPGVCQIARMRTAWADGGESDWPKLDAALARGDWEEAAKQCWPKDAGADSEDPTTRGRTTRQPKQYVESYLAVRQLYRLADDYPGDELPNPLPSKQPPLAFPP